MQQKTGQSLSPETGLILSILALLACCLLSYKTISEMTWPTVDGVVESISFGERRDPLSRNGAMLHCLNLKYSYTVEGDAYSDLKEFESSRSEATIKLRAHDLATGSKVKVHYNPVHPAENYINHVWEEAPLPVLFTITGFAFVCAVWQFLLLVRSKLFGQNH